MKTKLLSAAIALVASLGSFACSTPCEELAEKICACEPNRSAIEACKRRAQDRQSTHDPGTKGQARCEKYIDTCDCHAIGTAPGDRACGLAE